MVGPVATTSYSMSNVSTAISSFFNSLSSVEPRCITPGQFSFPLSLSLSFSVPLVEYDNGTVNCHVRIHSFAAIVPVLVWLPGCGDRRMQAVRYPPALFGAATVQLVSTRPGALADWNFLGRLLESCQEFLKDDRVRKAQAHASYGIGRKNAICFVDHGSMFCGAAKSA